MSLTAYTRASWRNMIGRCTNPGVNKSEYYLGRGVTVCERWLKSFDNFVADVGLRPLGKTLDRWPNSGGNYEPGNVRWATRKQQDENRKAGAHMGRPRGPATPCALCGALLHARKMNGHGKDCPVRRGQRSPLSAAEIRIAQREAMRT